MYNFIRVAAASPEVRSGDIENNIKNISNVAVELDRLKVQLVSFPELSISGYSCGEIFHGQHFTSRCISALEFLVESLSGTTIITVIGMPIQFKGKLYNCAVVCSGHGVHGIVPKCYLPNYNEFYETRWFDSSDSLPGLQAMNILGSDVPFGTNQIFRDTKVGFSFGVEICEDLWAPIPQSSYLALNGAELICNLSASNDVVGKAEYRLDLVKHQSAATYTGYIYSSCGPTDSSSEVVFSGDKIICEAGNLLERKRDFYHQGDYLISEIDTEILRFERMRNSSFQPCYDYHVEDISVCSPIEELKYRRIKPNPFIPETDESQHIVSKDLSDMLVAALKQKILTVPDKNLILGLSGGLDSTLALLVAVEAYRQLDLPLSNIFAFSMPGFGTSERTKKNAALLANCMGCSFKEIDITSICNETFKTLDFDPKNYSTTFENVQARCRTMILMNKSNQLGGFVLGTGDLSEAALGWCTYNGDQMSMYHINAGVPKSLVRMVVSNFLGITNETRAVLQSVVETPISPELLPTDKMGNIGQKTEDLIGSYELHDFFLFYYVRYRFSKSKLLFLATVAFKDAYSVDAINEALETFCKRFIWSQFKRAASPEGPKVGTISLSPRGDWRMPSDISEKVIS